MVESILGMDDEQSFWEHLYDQKRPAYWGHLKWVDWYYPFRRFDRRLRAYIDGRGYETFLDMGSGQGLWLIYAVKRLKLKAFGVDYSSAACKLASANLARADVEGTVVQGDFLDGLEIEPVDVIYLGGVIEHYPDPVEILRIALNYLKPGGTLVNRVPTSLGLNRFYWRILYPDRLATLKSVSLENLRTWYADISLEQIQAFYNGSFCLSMFPKEVLLPKPEWLHRLLVHYPVRLVDVGISSVLIGLDALGSTPESRSFSPQVIAFGTKARD